MSEENEPVVLTEESKEGLLQAVTNLTHYLQRIEQEKEGMKSVLAEAESDFGIKKKYINKMAKMMYEETFENYQQENSHFESLYETIVGESKARQD